MNFEWDEDKNRENLLKHNLSFEEAQEAFFDANRLIIPDDTHSTEIEQRFYCIGNTGNGIATVRFMYRNNKIRIFGARYWRKEKKRYEKENNLR
jgi:uncharacterized DUF497 family protein